MSSVELGRWLGSFAAVLLMSLLVGWLLKQAMPSMRKGAGTSFVVVSIATLITVVVASFGKADGGPPDYSDSLYYAIAGVAVLLIKWLTTTEKESGNVPHIHVHQTPATGGVAVTTEPPGSEPKSDNVTCCPECGGKISKRLPACSHCGYPIPKKVQCVDCSATFLADLGACPECGGPI